MFLSIGVQISVNDDMFAHYLRDTILWDSVYALAPQALYTLNRSFPFSGDTIDVLVFIWERSNGYEITSSIEARSSGPYDANHGSVDTLQEALARVNSMCKTYNEQYGEGITEKYAKV